MFCPFSLSIKISYIISPDHLKVPFQISVVPGRHVTSGQSYYLNKKGGFLACQSEFTWVCVSRSSRDTERLPTSMAENKGIFPSWIRSRDEWVDFTDGWMDGWILQMDGLYGWMDFREGFTLSATSRRFFPESMGAARS